MIFFCWCLSKHNAAISQLVLTCKDHILQSIANTRLFAVVLLRLFHFLFDSWKSDLHVIKTLFVTLCINEKREKLNSTKLCHYPHNKHKKNVFRLGRVNEKLKLKGLCTMETHKKKTKKNYKLKKCWHNE